MKKNLEKVITRFAPSPTGLFHIGSARTALFNYLFAKNKKGRFILRIEDTDKERSKMEYEKDIIESLKWLNIKWDKGPVRQSERKEIYKKYLEKLLSEGKAYRCFCTSEELEAKRQEQMSRGLAPKYDGMCASLKEQEIEYRVKKGERFVVRFKTPNRKIKFRDLIRGDIEFDGGLIGDFTISRGLDYPLYNFTVVVDDSDMEITHVIRGEDLLPNTPKQIFLEEALGFSHPNFAHLPLILGPDRSKLSKRHGATSLSEYKSQGYLPEAVINFLAFLGWNPGDEKEIFSLEGLIKEFSIERVQKSAAVFNTDKLDYLNGFYIRRMDAKKITELCMPYLTKANIITSKSDKKYIERAISLYSERIKKLSDITKLVDFFFKEKLDYDRGLLVWKDASLEETKFAIDRIINILSSIKDKDWKKEKLEKLLLGEAEKFASQKNKGKDRGCLLWPLRAAITGKKSSAGPFEVAEVLGRERVLNRLKDATNKI
jgi:glutamyl-tRNA synthetase